MEFLTHFKQLFLKIWQYFYVKLSFSGIFLILNGFLGYMFDEKLSQQVTAVFILVIFDFITGLYAAYKTGTPLESRKFVRSAIKIVMYAMLISAGCLAEKAMPIDFLDETIVAFLAGTEFISILENTGKAGYAIPQVLLNKVRAFNEN